MTIIAGAYSFDPDRALPAALLGELRKHISRDPADIPLEHRTPGFFAVAVDIGVFPGQGEIVDASGSATIVAGEPLLSDGEGDEHWHRGDDLAVMHRLFRDGDQHALKRARGTFCGLHYDAAGHALHLFVDKVGVRPLYVWAGPDFVVFASALRILEAVGAVPKHFDVRGVTELAALAYPLAERTPYRGIGMLRPGESVRATGGALTHERYWRWDGPLEEVDYQTGVRRAYDAFVKAIGRRQRAGRAAAAFLSGGLDSRVIVGGLAAAGAEVYSVNYAPDGSQDQVFARLVADHLGLRHTQIETNAHNVAQGYRKNAVKEWLASTFAGARSPIVWSGDGGSVGLGNVYMTPQIVAAMERGATDEAIRLFTRGVPQRIIRRDSLGQVADLTFKGVQEELAAIEGPDPGRRFQLFLMFNDQRRHLAQHFEDIDVDRIEFQLPFFDADFLDAVLRLPNDWFMAHRFYMDWIAHFPNALASIPWQAYPGHIPCTLPSPPGLKYQWDQYYDKKMYAQMRRDTARRGSDMLATERFPDHLISRGTLRLASLLTRTGLRDYSYLIKTASVYHRYWSASEDQVAA
jgi:hypothetical protein